MAIITADEFLKQTQGAPPSSGATPPVVQPQVRENPIKYTSAVPEDWGEVPVLSGIGENILAGILRPAEQFVRAPFAASYEAGRTGGMLAYKQLASLLGKSEDEVFNKLNEAENPFIPGINKATNEEIASDILTRGAKANLEALTLGKGGLALGLKGWLGSAVRGATGFGMFEAAQPKATEQDVATASLMGAGFGPAARLVGQYAPLLSDLVRKKSVVPPAVSNALLKELGQTTALVTTPTPAEQAAERALQRYLQQQAGVRNAPVNYPAGTQVSPGGAVQVPEGGYQPFKPEGFTPTRAATEGVAVPSPASSAEVGKYGRISPTGQGAGLKPTPGDQVASSEIATKLLYDLMGPKKAAALQAKIIAEQAGSPYATIEKIPMKPYGQRPTPVHGEYAVEKPYDFEITPEVETVIKAVAPDVPNVVPAETAIKEIPPEKITPSALDVFGRNLWQPMQAALSKMGGAGKELSASIDRFRANEFTFRGKNQAGFIKDFPKLTPTEQFNYFETVEGRASPMNEKVAQAVNANQKWARFFYDENIKRGMLENMIDDTGSPVVDPTKYVPHMLNEKGWGEYNFNEDAFFKKMAAHNGLDVQTMRDTWIRYISKNITPKAFFERQRTFRIPPDFLERDPMKLWGRYNAVAAKRYALLDEFGRPLDAMDDVGNPRLDYPKLKQTVGAIGQQVDMDSARYAREAIDMMLGRWPTDFQARHMVGKLMEFQLISKLNPLTTLANIQQGLLASIYHHGLTYAARGVKEALSKKGAEWVTKTGLVGQGFYSPPRFTKASNAWAKITGFPLSEDWNFRIITNSAKEFLTDMYGKLAVDPTNKAIRQHFKIHGLDPDTLLKQGGPTEDDLLKGAFIVGRDSIFPRLVEQAPKWTQNPMGKLIYQFSHYALKQPEMLTKQFGVSKTHGLSALLKFAAAQSILGEPVADIWSMMRGRKRPEDLPTRLLDNIMSSGAFGIPAELFKTMAGQYTGVAGPFAGPTVSGLMETGARVLKDVGAGRGDKAVEDLIRARVRGDIPWGGPPIPAGAFLEKLIPREPLEKD